MGAEQQNKALVRRFYEEIDREISKYSMNSLPRITRTTVLLPFRASQRDAKD